MSTCINTCTLIALWCEYVQVFIQYNVIDRHGQCRACGPHQTLLNKQFFTILDSLVGLVCSKLILIPLFKWDDGVHRNVSTPSIRHWKAEARA